MVKTFRGTVNVEGGLKLFNKISVCVDEMQNEGAEEKKKDAYKKLFEVVDRKAEKMASNMYNRGCMSAFVHRVDGEGRSDVVKNVFAVPDI